MHTCTRKIGNSAHTFLITVNSFDLFLVVSPSMKVRRKCGIYKDCFGAYILISLLCHSKIFLANDDNDHDF